MQHIGLQRQSETGEVLARFDADGIDTRIVSRAPPSTACLRFIDPYGDTTFNQLQLPVLVSELIALRETVREHDLQTQIDRLLAFLGDSQDSHVYVCFLGD